MKPFKKLILSQISPKAEPEAGVWCGCFILEVTLRPRNEAVGRVEQQENHEKAHHQSYLGSLPVSSVLPGLLGSPLSAREDLGENQVEITVTPSRCNTGRQRIS